MFKKFLMLMGASVLFLGLTGCAGDDYDAFELLERSHETMEDADSMIMEFEMEMGIEAGFFTEEMAMSGRIEMEMLSDTDLNMAMEMTMREGMSVATGRLYFRDGYMYMDVLGERMREPMDMDEALDMANEGLLETDIDEDWIEDSSVERLDNGYRLSFTLNMVAMEDALADIPEATIEDGTFEMVVYLDEDYNQIAAELDLEITMDVMGMTGVMTMHMTMEIVQVGNVTVNFPAWLDELANPIEEADEDDDDDDADDNGDNGDEDEDDDNDGNESALLGTWAWEGSDTFRLVFNEDGSGEWIGLQGAFTWTTDGNELRLTSGGLTQRWEYSISGNRLTISSLDLPGLEYVYIRR